MEPLQRYRAMKAFCRQRSKMDGEDAGFWLAEAEVWERRERNVRTGLAGPRGDDTLSGPRN